ncbi:SDR family NAD(P)-dependent oxidoreductase [Nocardia sp. NPDC052112]|uniref:SDR family NAD(P)-dependent oxidoreductase n=1 Tax=Nocardia sp. NPDC052112 TaxID=3155646 RepID=UPI003426969A
MGPVPPDRWDAARLMALQNPDEAERYGRGCFLEGDVWAWDPEALSVAPSEQRWIDPQFRVLMEVAWEAVEHAGLPIDRLRGSRTGVYVGAYAPDNLFREARPPEDAADSAYMFGNFTGTMVGRLAFGMDLRGPVMALNTMCSSGLVAVNTACTALIMHDCDVALAGAVLLMVSPETQHYEASLLLSQRGHCYAFDSRADGYVRGEGAGMLVLKRLADARRDGDRVLAVARGAAVNNDGQSTRLTAPSTEVQQALYREAIARSGIDPGDVGLVEAHGPGTAVGDPVEYTSINAVYGRGRGRCAVGSIKTNIGHSEPVSGIAGVLKAIQCLRYGMIPANLNFRSWNPAIPLDENTSRLFVPTELTPWPVDGEPRLAAVCSYGVTGTNAHIVIEQAPQTARIGSPPRRAVGRRAARPRLFVLSSASPQGLTLSARRLADWSEKSTATIELDDLAHTLDVRRSHGPHRLGVVAATHAELVTRLRAFAEREVGDGFVAGSLVLPEQHAGPVFVFTGQGSQWVGMCQGMLDDDPGFTAAINEVEPLISAESGFSVREMICKPTDLVGVDRIQPTLFAIQVALAAMWRSWGVRPTAVVGQSLGEVAAAVVAGALSLTDGVAVICRRATLLAETAGGVMASVMLPAETVGADIEAAGADAVSIAVLTAPESTVISGDAAQVAALVADWLRRDIVARMVNVDVASHSAQMNPILDRLHDALTGLSPRQPEAVFYSTVTATPRDPGMLDERYWVRNQREMVKFSGAVAAALRDGHRLFVECAPHPVSMSAITAIAKRREIDDTVAVGSLRRDTDDHEAMLTSLATAFCAGADIDWAAHYGAGNLVEAPGTAWHRVRHGGDNPPYRLVAPGLVGADQHPLLGGYICDPEQPDRHLWQTPISPHRVPWLTDHRVAGVPVLPGTGFAEMMVAAAQRVFGTERVSVTNLSLTSPLVLDPEPVITTRVIVEAHSARAEIVSRTAIKPLVHATAILGTMPATESDDLELRRPTTLDWQDIAPSELYRRFRDRHNVDHGPAFTGVERIQLDPNSDRALGAVRLDSSARVSAWTMALHPALADELVQLAVSVWVHHHTTSPGPVVVAGFQAIRVYGPTSHARIAQVILHHADDLRCTASGTLAATDGTVVAEVVGLRLSNVTPPEERFAARLIHPRWVVTPVASAPSVDRHGHWVVLGEGGDWPAHLAAALRDRGASCRSRTVPDDFDESALTAAVAGQTAVVLAMTEEGDEHPAKSARKRVDRVRVTIKTLAALASPPRLWLAVRTNRRSPSCAGIRGIARVAAYECPQLLPSMVEVDPGTPTDLVAADLIAADRCATEIAWRDSKRFTSRLRAGAPEYEQTRRCATTVRPGAAYVVTGGLGGLGLLSASWLARNGAGRVILCGRSAPGPETLARLAELRAVGAAVTVVNGDIADPAVAAAAVRAATKDGALLRGIIHAAGLVEDATLAKVDTAMLERVWRGKAEGAWAMHAATLDHDLDFWVVYSSVASLLGSPGQAAHAAANSFLDDLVQWRAAQDLPATSICWGAWSEVGSGQHMAERGFAMISPTDGIDALERILANGYTHIGYSPIDLERWLASYPAVAQSTLFSDLLAARDNTSPESALLDELLAADTEPRRRAILNAHIIESVRDILGGSNRHITPSTSMVLLGLDSLAAVQLQNRLQHALAITIESGAIWVRPTPAGLTDWILNRMGMLSDEEVPDEDVQRHKTVRRSASKPD